MIEALKEPLEHRSPQVRLACTNRESSGERVETHRQHRVIERACAGGIAAICARRGIDRVTVEQFVRDDLALAIENGLPRDSNRIPRIGPDGEIGEFGHGYAVAANSPRSRDHRIASA